MRIGKMSSGTAKFPGITVHHLHKPICRTTHMLCNSRCCVITWINQQTMKKLIHSHLVTCPKAANLWTLLQIQILLCNGYYVIHISIFQCQHSCHDLGDTCRVYLLKCLFGIKHLSVIQIQKKSFLVFPKGNTIHRNIWYDHTQILSKTISSQAV